MTDLFMDLATRLLRVEGGYSNHPSDRGGETMWGVTIGVARENGYTGAMRDMTKEQAFAIYRRAYWERPGFHLIGDVSPKIAEELFDTGVNMGVGIPGVWLQRALNALNSNGQHYADIMVDGQVGPATARALSALIAKRGRVDAEKVILRALNAFQAVRYIELCEKRQANEAFGWGWLSQRVGME